MTISFNQAKFLAHKAIKELSSESGDEFCLIDENTLETSNGWIFFYNTREFYETGDPVTALAGNGPILVDTSGSVSKLSTSTQWETLIKSA